MSQEVWAGIDIGNSTTEVALGRPSRDGVEILAVGRTPTRGDKGSQRSLENAAALVRSLERRHDVRADAAAVAPLRPVRTLTATVSNAAASTGRLRVVGAGVGTTGGNGVAVGRPCPLDRIDRSTGPVVAIVPRGTGYDAAVATLWPLVRSGDVVAVLLEDDEAVLVANRLPAAVPVVDEIVADDVLGAERVVVECAGAGSTLRTVTDPLRLMTLLDLTDAEREHAVRVSSRLIDVTNAVVCRVESSAEPEHSDRGWVTVEGRKLSYTDAHRALGEGEVGMADGYALPVDDQAHSVDDLFMVDLTAIGESVMSRRGVAGGRAIGLAALHSDAASDPRPALAAMLGGSVHLVESEAAAARAGGLSTPGSDRAAMVVDLGAGTVDVVAQGSSVVAAGGGELLTVSVAQLTRTTRAVSEWVKRGPAQRVEAPQLVLTEDGSRRFLDTLAPVTSIGQLAVEGPAGLLPFSRTLAPGEWRALRLRLKVELLGGNLRRATRSLGAEPRTVIVVGGPAGDDEILDALVRALPDGTAIGRGDVGGRLGHRYAVAYGLIALSGAASPMRTRA